MVEKPRSNGPGPDPLDRAEFRLRELDHRARNTLATIQGIIDQLAASSDSVEQFAAALKLRVAGMAALHDALGRDGAEVDVVRMVRMSLEPHALGEGRIEVRGVNGRVRHDVAAPLFLALHELAINARKHGALSVPSGRVVVDVATDEATRVLEIDWQERDGPPVPPPARRGFGTTVIRRGLEYEVGGDADLAFEPGGLRARLRVPLDAPAP